MSAPAEHARAPEGLDVARAFQDSRVQEILDDLDRDLVGLDAVKTRLRERRFAREQWLEQHVDSAE